MVVTRRQSTSPLPPATSRTNSSSGSSRSSKGKGVDKSSPLKDPGTTPSYVPPNGTPSKPPPVGPRSVEEFTFDDDPQSVPLKFTPTKTLGKSKAKPKSKKPPKSQRNPPIKGVSLFDMMARLFLLWLTIYTISVCPEDTSLRSPICRTLTEYRRVILEPYIYPPVRAALDHPAVAPYVQRLEPYYKRTVEISIPLVRRVKREWHHRVVPQILWLQHRTRPYVLRIQERFYVVVGPHLQKVSNAAWQYKLQAEPYVLNVALKSHRSWEAAKPYLMPVWLKAKSVPEVVAVYVGGPLGQARRRWVDPHVIKIWDKVVEQGRARTLTAQTTSTASTSFMLAHSLLISSFPIMQLSGPAVASHNTTVAASTPTKLSTDEASAPASPVMSENDSSTSAIHNPSTSSPAHSSTTPSVILDSESATMSDKTDTASGDTSNPGSDSVSSIASIPEETATVVSSVVSTPSSSDERSLPLSAKFDTEIEDADVDDLDEFLSELERYNSAPEVEETPAPEPEESEEERQERFRRIEIENAEKRADLEARHTQWEIELEKQGKAQRKVVRATLKRLRDAAAEEARAPNGPVRAPIEELVQEAEKSLKSLKAYARKLATEDKVEKEKIEAWETVVEKVDKKFGERVDHTAEILKEWWDVKIAAENREIDRIHGPVRYVADRAEEILGMEYTWLPGVTWEDWQRYHKLALVTKQFAELYAGMQNGSVPNAPANPVADIMEAIQEEVDDMILGFESSLSRVRSAVIDSLSGTRSAAVTDKSASPVIASDPASVPEASILPIDHSAQAKEVPPVILSRGAEEVKSAVSMAEAAKTKAAHDEL